VLCAKTKKADKGYAMPEEWQEFVGKLIGDAIANHLPAQRVRELLENEEIKREENRLKALSPAERKKEAATAKQKAKARKEQEKAKFISHVASKASELGIDLAAALGDGDKGQEAASKPETDTAGQYTELFTKPDVALKAAQLVQWTPEAALALVNGAIRSNHDNSGALAAILTRLAEYARAVQEAAAQAA
jgi:hypothetical protein